MKEQLNLVVSVGIAPSKFVAKVASDLSKPDGLLVVCPDEVRLFLDPLPVKRIFGVGKVTLKALHRLGLRTIGELARYPSHLLVQRFGDHGAHLAQLARGEDDRPVIPEHQAQSVGHEDTFDDDKDDRDELELILLEQADRVAARLRKSRLRASTVVLKVKTTSFKVLTRRHKLPCPSCDGTMLGHEAQELLRELLHHEPGPFRLTGVTGTDLMAEEEPQQLTLDAPQQRQRDQISQTLDAINERYGKHALTRAALLKDKTEE